MTKTAGTKEWATTNVNFITGCKHNCRYCYAKRMALRFKRIDTPEDWQTMVLRPDVLNKNYKKRNGRIMFPSSHDLTPEFIHETLTILGKLLKAGNSVLITTKPHLSVIRDICDVCAKYKDQVQFRFTIGSHSNKTLEWWEPGAPGIEERMESLKHAFAQGYRTSVSMEPLLTLTPERLVEILEPYVTESIWVGVMNGIPADIPKFHRDFIKATRTKTYLLNIYTILKDHPLVRWKDSVRHILDLPK